MTLSHYFRYPHVHGNLVTFVAENDVWVAPLDGGRAWRVSALQLPARNPRFSPDGSHIAWTVIQGKSPEAVCAAADGGHFRQLTFWGHASTVVRGFTSDGDVLVTSSFESEESRHRWAYRVPLDGTPGAVLPFGPVESVAYGADQAGQRAVVVASVLSREPAWWKRYRGGTAGKLWIDPDGAGTFSRLAPELDGNLADPMWVDGRVAFLSDHEDHGNLYSLAPDGTDLRRHTDHQDFYVRHASTDGNRIVFESAGALWLLRTLGDEPERLDISLGSATTSRRPAMLAVDEHLDDVRPDQTGRASVVGAHGTVHWLTHRDGPARALEVTDGVRARLARPLGTDRVAYIADHDGVEALYVRPANGGLDTADAAEPQANSAETRIGLGGYGRVSELATSPDGHLVAVATEFGDLLLAEVDTGQLRCRSTSVQGAIDEVVFAPDSAWIAWIEPVTGEAARAKLRLAPVADTGVYAGAGAGAVAADSARIIDITDGRFRDHSPAFTADGKYLAFLSERSFDPVYDTHQFDLSFPASTKPYLVSLSAETPSPFGPAADGADPAAADPKSAVGPKSAVDQQAGGGQGPGDSNAEAGSSAAETVRPLTVDGDRISERLIPVPVPQGTYRRLEAVPGALLWIATDIVGVTGDGRADGDGEEPASRLERFDLATRKMATFVDEADDYRLSGDRQRMTVLRGGKLHLRPASHKIEDDAEEHVSIDLSRIRVRLDPLKVWGQAFDEAWRLQRDFYWTPDMAGLDWDEIHRRYSPLVGRLGSHDDLVDLLWEMHGELGTSHAYVQPVGTVEPGVGAQGRLGADLARTARGWEVERVLAAESSDPQAVSPLSTPGANVLAGDVLLAVDGVAVPAETGTSSLLVGAADKTVELTVLNGPGHGDGAGRRRRIAVVPLADEERLRYQNWVLANRAAVRAASGGRYGYLHVPDMIARGWSQLHRDLDVETALDGLVVDVRANRGGHTSQLVAELIGRKVTSWDLARGEQPGTYPAHATRGPVVILADEFSGSDGDIITQVSKLRGIGPVIGMRTWGGVIGIDGRFTLADGTGVTQPRYATWFTGGIGWGVENYGVDPDIEVPFPPHAHGARQDPQLERAVEVLGEMIAETPTDRPPAREGFASRKPAPLPPRPQGGGATGS